MNDVNVEKFNVLGSGYARDNENIYYAGKKVKDVDYKSFMAMESGYARDFLIISSTLFDPSSCPIHGSNPCSFAQRRFPSGIIAT